VRRLLALGVVAACGLVACGPFGADEREGFLVGVFDDAVKLPEPSQRMATVRGDGFNALRVTAIWVPGQTEPSPEEVATLRKVVAAADRNEVRVFLSVFHPHARDTPLTDEARAQFAGFTASLARSFPRVKDFIIGNEPNINTFWMPQFGPDGSNAAAADYVTLLGETYDALKAVSDDIQIVGGVLAPRGADNPEGTRHTHSPATFIRDMGTAYRASGREEPLMDVFAFHPYPQSSQNPPDVLHPPESNALGLADYDRIVDLLGEAFDGTEQEGSELPILYTEFGTETHVPPDKVDLYEGEEPISIEPVDPGTQARYYRRAIELAACQENVRGIFIFHVFDEQLRYGWQSGVRYVDGTPKPSRDPVREAALEARAGKIDCPDD
jgi:hypothetical protein